MSYRLMNALKKIYFSLFKIKYFCVKFQLRFEITKMYSWFSLEPNHGQILMQYTFLNIISWKCLFFWASGSNYLLTKIFLILNRQNRLIYFFFSLYFLHSIKYFPYILLLTLDVINNYNYSVYLFFIDQILLAGKFGMQFFFL